MALGIASRFTKLTSTTLVVATLAAGPMSFAAQAQEAAPLAPADEDKARAHFRLGRAHYDNGNFAEAAVEMEEAYRISQRSALLYNIYLAYRDANDTRRAAEALRLYLDLEKDVENRAQLESRLAALQRSLADGTAAQPGPAPTPAPATEPAPAPAAAEPVVAAPAEVTEPDEPEQKKSQVLPIALMGGGGAMVVGGVIVWTMASGKASDCKTDASACDSGKTLALVGDLLTFGGAAVAGTGLVLFLLNQSGGSESDSATAGVSSPRLMCGPTGCIARVNGRF